MDSYSSAITVSVLRDAMRRNARENRRQSENIRLYDGTEFGQWVGADTQQLIADGKYPHTFNLISKAVDTIVGSVIVDQMETHFTPEFGEKNNLSIMLNMLNIEDSELGHYLDELTQVLRMGFVYRGWVEIYKDKSQDPRGRVGYRYLSGDKIVVDPDWKTKNRNDNKQLFITSWMSAQEIKDTYNAKSAEIDNAIQLRKQSEGTYGGYGAQELDKLYDLSPEYYDQINDLYLVYDKLTLVKVKKKKLFDVERQEFVTDVEPEDMQMFSDAAKAAGRDLEVVEEEATVCKVETGAPAISVSLKLQSGDHPIQVGGYPIIPFACDALNGRPITPVDKLKDVQQAINKRETTITHILMTSAHDTLLIETSAVENPDTDIERIGKGSRRPGAYFGIADGGLNKIQYLRGNRNPPTDFLTSANHLREISRELTPAVPAVQATEEGKQSGILFQSKVAQAQIGMVLYKRNITAFFEQLSNAWFMAAREIYSYPMVLTGDSGSFRLNMPGGVYMSEIPRMRVTITQSPKSETLRRTMLQNYIATSQYSPDPLSKMVLWRQTVAQLPDVPDDKLKELEAASSLSEKREILRTEIEIKGMEQQLQAMQAPQMPPGMPGPGGPGAPPGPPGQPPNMPGEAPIMAGVTPPAPLGGPGG